jgi:polyisoprenoid-binding protein YceI
LLVYTKIIDSRRMSQMSVTDTITARQLVPGGTWKADPAHSTFEFTVRHMGITSVKGRFTDVEATLLGGDSPSLEGTLGIASVDTRDEGRDGHLKSADFFDAERFPVSRFESVAVEADRVLGLLTLKGVTREIELAAELTGGGTDPYGNERIGLDLEGEIDRTDFGVSWNAPLPGGGLLVADRVKLAASFSFVREA